MTFIPVGQLACELLVYPAVTNRSGYTNRLLIESP
jgi:hypothetical protein